MMSATVIYEYTICMEFHGKQDVPLQAHIVVATIFNPIPSVQRVLHVVSMCSMTSKIRALFIILVLSNTFGCHEQISGFIHYQWHETVETGWLTFYNWLANESDDGRLLVLGDWYLSARADVAWDENHIAMTYTSIQLCQSGDSQLTHNVFKTLLENFLWACLGQTLQQPCSNVWPTTFREEMKMSNTKRCYDVAATLLTTYNVNCSNVIWQHFPHFRSKLPLNVVASLT